MREKGVVLTVGELKEMLERFGEEMMIRFADGEGREFKFCRLDSDPENTLRLKLQT